MAIENQKESNTPLTAPARHSIAIAAPGAGAGEEVKTMAITWNDDGSATVLSDSGHTYRVKHESPYMEEDVHIWTCNCPAAQHGRDCKHARAVIADAERLAAQAGA